MKYTILFNKRCKRSKCSVNTELLINMLKNKKQQGKRNYIKIAGSIKNYFTKKK